jgi:gamma-glutamyltranspeptidase/glutathione hydrolase
MLPPEPGFILTNPDLANSLRIIAAKGPDAFYTGEIGQAIMDDVQAFGGYMTMEDLANYQAILRPPVRGNYRGYEILSAGPPVGGSTVIEALHILENFDVASLGYPSAQAIHLTAEAIRIAYRDNYEYLGDPDFDNVPIDDLLGKHYARDRALEIDPNRMKTKDDILPGYFGVASVVHAGADYVPHESPSTTHISIVDKDQNMVSLTQTIGSFFGAGVMPEGTGIVLNNELANFEAVDAGVNALRASKRMKTCISPTIVLKNGEPFLAIGTPGAGRIISTLTILLSALIDHGMTLQEAIEAPRFYVRDTHDNIEFESRLSSDTLSILRAKGWGLLERSEFDLYFGGVQGVLLDLERGELVGGTDPRRGGAALGY